MRTPRTVDEIADAILPASIDGLHERALCLLLAEHERSFHELENRCRLLESRSYAANERLDALDRCEPVEEGRPEASASASVQSAAASDQRAPGSTAPTTEQMDEHAHTLERLSRLHEISASDSGYLSLIARRIRALAADRDRLLAKLEEMIDLPTTEEEVEIDDLRQQCDRLARSVKSYQWDAQRHAQAEDALARRIEEMARREPTDSDVMKLREEWLSTFDREDVDSVAKAWCRLFLAVRDALLATPASEPTISPGSSMEEHVVSTDTVAGSSPARGTSATPEPLSEPRCGLATASEASEGPKCDHEGSLRQDGMPPGKVRCADCGVIGEFSPLPPQPAPATPSEVIGWYSILQNAAQAGYTRMEAQARAVAAEVSRLEAALRDRAERAEAEISATEDARDRYARDANRLERDLAAARAQLDPEREHYIAEALRGHLDECLGCCRCNLAAYERTRKEAK